MIGPVKAWPIPPTEFKDLKAANAYVRTLYAALAENSASLSASIGEAATTVTPHVLVSTSHTASGLTAGHFLKTTAATTFAFGAHGLIKSDVGLGSVEDTALSTWAGTSNITTVGALTQQAWQEILDASMTNSWVNFGGTTVNSTAYFKDSLGVVHLKGVIKSGTITSAAFTLPAGYRPSRREYFPSVSNDLFGFALVNADGTIIPQVGNNAYFTLDGITFRAA